jgi:hypothetical protein
MRKGGRFYQIILKNASHMLKLGQTHDPYLANHGSKERFAVWQKSAAQILFDQLQKRSAGVVV